MMQSKPFNRKISTTIKNAQKVKERREQIFQAAFKLIRKKGYHNTTLRDISKESGISLGNLYDYIRTKEDILYLVHEKAAQLVFQARGDRPKAGGNLMKELKDSITKEMDTIDKYQDLILSIYQESHALSKPSLKALLGSEEDHMNRFAELLQEGMEAGVFRRVNPVIIANLIKIMIDGWVLRRWTLRKNVNLEEMKRGIVQLVEQGIRNPQKKSEETGGRIRGLH